jgi:hypothetical protein
LDNISSYLVSDKCSDVFGTRYISPIIALWGVDLTSTKIVSNSPSINVERSFLTVN